MKTERYEMRFSPREKKLAQRAAHKREMTLADFIRRAVEEKANSILGTIGNAK